MPKPPAFHASQRLQRAYEQGIRVITGRVLTPKQSSETFHQWLARLAQRTREYDVREASEELAKRMILSVAATNAKTWRQAASRSTQAHRLYQLLQNEMAGATGLRVNRLIRENAALISSVPLESATKLVEEIATAQQSGARPKTVAKMAATRFPELLRSRTHLISRTETQKASTALTQARCETLNLDWMEWGTSEDQRTRKSHKNMNGVLCSWHDLPSPEKLVGEKSVGTYAPGQIYNCRCVVLPLLAFSDVSWPRRVYRDGSIATMTLAEFKAIAAKDSQIAA